MQIRKLAAVIGIFMAIGSVAAAGIFAANMLTNGGFDRPFDDTGRVWRDQHELVASGWHPFWIAANTYDGDGAAAKLHWMSAKQFATYFGGYDYRVEGNQAQNMWSSYDFDAGVYQQIAVTPGLDYAFDVGMVTYWRGPGYPDTDGVMVKMVGIDPAGGTDPTAPGIVWSDPDSNDKFWAYMDVAATAQSPTVTVFAKVSAPENTSSNHVDLDMVYFDAAHFDLAPLINSFSVMATGTTISADWSGAAQSDWTLKGYEAQYRDESNATWVSLQSKSSQNTSVQFDGVAGHRYRVRVRAWQTRVEDYNADIDMPGVWQERTVTLGGVLDGTIFNNTENAVSGAAVVVSGTMTQTTSGSGGQFSLVTGEGTFGITATTTGGWTSPSPVWAAVPDAGTAAITLTLRPPDDFIANGDVDGSLAGWQHTLAAPKFDAVTPRAGSASLCITETGSLTATAVVTDIYRPTLSFWARTHGDGDDILTAEIFVPDVVSGTAATAITGDSGWRHIFVPLNVTAIPVTGTANFGGSGALPFPEVYSGSIGVRFTITQTGTPTEFCVDEISAGSQWGGANKVFLPLILR